MNTQRPAFFSNIPPVILNLLIINVLFWLASIVLPQKFGIDMSAIFGLHYWGSEKFNPLQLISYMFMHQTHNIEGEVVFTHIFFNMFSVYMFGSILERVWGSKKFLFYYLVTGIGAGIVQELSWMFEFRELLMNPAMQINIGAGQIISQADFFGRLVTVGASGAVFGILLAFGWMFPEEKLIMLFFPVPIKARIFVTVYAVLELFLGVANFRFDSVAHFAHLGGMLFGLLLILYWKKTGKLFWKKI